MKRVFFVLAFFVTLVFVFSSCKKNEKNLIVGKWEIDSVYYENQEETFRQIASHAIETAEKNKQILEDSLKAMENRGLKSSIDSLYYQTFQNQLSSITQMIDYYSNYEDFRSDMLKSASDAKGSVFEFKKDSTLIFPNSTEPAKWYIKNDSLFIVVGNSNMPMDIVSLSKKELVLRATQRVDTSLALTIVYKFNKTDSK